MSARSRLMLDAGLFAALLAANNPAWTGLSVHEWLSIALITPLLVHLIVNWEWAVRTVVSFANRVRNVSRVNLIVDSLLFFSTVTVMLSGLVVSRSIAGAFGIATAPSIIWYALHSVSADATILLLLVHLGLHWRWVFRTAGRLVSPRTAPQRRTLPALATTARQR